MQFGLQFETVAPERKLKAAEPAKEAAASKQPESKPEPAAAAVESAAQDEAAKVVSLDQFRKK